LIAPPGHTKYQIPNTKYQIPHTDMNLVIVESPTKARKLATYLGKEFKIEASVGHVRDLPKSKLGVDLENDFEPTYEVPHGKGTVVKKLQKLAKDADAIYLAMDPDREGEAIAWHVKHLLEEAGLTDQEIYQRSVFFEITKKAVLAAVEKPGKVNQDLVDAQQARRVLDRLVGYKLSPVLWRKVRRGLSAGRVQSVALRLIVEREREREEFKPDEYWEIDVALDSSENIPNTKYQKPIFTDGKPADDLPLEILISSLKQINNKKQEISSEDQAKPVIADLKKADYAVTDVERKERRQSSYPPFTTSTLQQAGAYVLGFSAKQTMSLAQQLYEEGLITYHRTDAMNLSASSIKMARSHIQDSFGKEYLPEKPRIFKGKSKNAQEAHEAIRVTDVGITQKMVPSQGAKLSDRHAKLYDLIWRRFIASQMTPAVYDQTSIIIEAVNSANKDTKYELRCSGSIMKFPGWRKLFPAGQDTQLPEVEPGQKLGFLDINPQQKFTQPPPRYNDASLVKELEKRGIGRPSTYASIISVIQDRAYVEREDKAFCPTAIGYTVSDFLLEHFPNVMDYDFTAEMEEDLDRISRGEKEWKKVIGTFWQPLENKIDDVVENAERAQIPVEKTGEKCPTCGDKEGGEVVLRTGKYGKFKSCSRYPDCDYTEDYTETLDDRPCPLCAEGEIVIKNTRWGKKFYGCSRYPECDWASWKKPEPGLKVTQEEWKEIQAKKAEWKKKRSKGKKKGGKKAKKAKK
jgi:DNA topoisomerase-1